MLIALTRELDGKRIYINASCIESVTPALHNPDHAAITTSGRKGNWYVKESADSVAAIARLQERMKEE